MFRFKVKIDDTICKVKELLANEDCEIDIKDLFALGYQYSIRATTIKQYLTDCLMVAITTRAYAPQVIKSLRHLHSYVLHLNDSHIEEHFEEIVKLAEPMLDGSYGSWLHPIPSILDARV